MRKFTVTLTAAALVLGTMGLTGPVLKSSCAEPPASTHSRTQH